MTKGVIVAFFLTEADAQGLALPPDLAGTDVLPASELHITLLHLGEVDTYSPEQRALIQSHLAEFARQMPPVLARVSGVGRFHTTEPGETEPLYASVDAPGLQGWHLRLQDQIAYCVHLRPRYGLDPHITLAYLPQDAPTPTVRPALRELVFGRLALAWGDEVQTWPLEGRQVKSAARGHVTETKVAAEFKEIEGRIVTGYPSVFGVVDDGGDVARNGSFLKTLDERGHRMRWLWQHDREAPPVARILEAVEVGRDQLPARLLERYPDATGAVRVKREYLDTPRGNEILAAIRAGALDEMSFGYDTIRSAPGAGKSIGGRRVKRFLDEVRVWEFSDVNWGMNSATTNVKSLLVQTQDGRMTVEELVEQLKAANLFDEVAAHVKSLAGMEQAVRAGDPDALADRRRQLEVMERRLALV